MKKLQKVFNVIPSDRIPMIFAANSFIGAIIHKETAVAVPQEITAEEATTYKSALDFLARQFQIGYKEPEINEVGVTVESCECGGQGNPTDFPQESININFPM